MKKLPIICLVDTSIYNSFEKLHATNIALELFHNLVGSRLADLHLILPNEVPQLSC